jgi:outer membrane receptor for ferrienterochelin and colicins
MTASGRVSLYLAFSLSLSPLAARAADTTDLDALLGETIVSTPSRNSETATTAPATSSILTAEDLRRWGIRTLDEAINYLALGMVTSEPLHAVEIGARGVLITGDYGNHILVLLDGHALNEPWNSTAYFDRGLAVPLDMIDHIEIILGPGSVLYGSQAMLGVIQIVTKRARDHAGLSLAAEGALGFPTRRSGALISPTFNSSYLERLGRGYRLAAGYGGEFSLFGERAELTLGIDYYRQDGPSFELGPQAYGNDAVTGAPKNFGPRGTPGVWGGVTHAAYYTEVPALYTRLMLGDWTLATRAALYTRASPYIDGLVNALGDFDDAHNREVDRWLNASLAYRHTMSEVLDISLRGYTDSYLYRWTDETSAAEDCYTGVLLGCTQHLSGGGSTLGGETQLSFNWLPELRVNTLLGVDSSMRWIASSYEVLDRGTRLPLDVRNDHVHGDVALAAYAQQSLSPTSWLDLNLGARWDYAQRSGSALSPRSALGITPWASGRLKLIYSEAFRAPSAYEFGYADYSTQISPQSLSAETVRSIEGSFEQRFGAHRLLFGLFRSWWADMVSVATLSPEELADAQRAGALDPNTTEGYVYENIDKIDNFGFNAAYEGSLLANRLRYGLNLTRAYSRTAPGAGAQAEQLTVGPSLFGNARVSYDLGSLLPTLALAMQFQNRRLADRAIDGGFTPVPTAPTHLEFRLTASGDVPGVSQLSYRLSGNYAASRVSPYVIGPVAYASDESTPYELAPLQRLQLFVGLSYHPSH